ncbi:MAG: Holliday junction branch migration protein RuvA, partial [Fusobacteriaceae bacterium]
VNGIGYKVFTSLKTYDKIVVGSTSKLYIYNHIKEDAFKLVGFLEERDRVVFEMLLSVSGVGVSLALSILSSFEIREIRRIVIDEDSLTLKSVPKLGEKKSKQVILDLKNKISALNIVAHDLHDKIEPADILEEELYFALESLGYSKKEIDSLVSRDEIRKFESIESAVKFVLKKIQEKKK